MTLRRFRIDIGFNPETEEHKARIFSVTETPSQWTEVESKTLSTVLGQVKKLVLQKDTELRNSPLPVLPEPSRIITLNGN